MTQLFGHVSVPCAGVDRRLGRKPSQIGRMRPTTKAAMAKMSVPIVNIRNVDADAAPPGPTPNRPRRPSCIPSTQMMAPMAIRTNATTASSPLNGQRRRRVTATVTATERPDRLQASSVRSLARPGSPVPPLSGTGSVLCKASVDSYFEPMRARTTAMTATNPTPMESTSGIGERGSGWPRRMALSLALQ
jgi:hypothetical protein